MRLHSATITANTLLRPDVHSIELYAPTLAQAVLPGQYGMVRCAAPQALDPLLRRPFFIQRVYRERGSCSLLIHVRGRGTAWLAQQREGTALDLLGPLGHGWTIHATTRNLLLISEGPLIAALPLVAQVALEQELAVTLVSQVETASEAYPPALLPPEAEYHIVTSDGSLGQQRTLLSVLEPYLNWADSALCSVSHETSITLYNHFERLRRKNVAQGIMLRPLACGTGACFACTVELHSGQKLVCRDGPIFDMREIAR